LLLSCYCSHNSIKPSREMETNLVRNRNIKVGARIKAGVAFPSKLTFLSSKLTFLSSPSMPAVYPCITVAIQTGAIGRRS
jgi:hypothetical protein